MYTGPSTVATTTEENPIQVTTAMMKTLRLAPVTCFCRSREPVKRFVGCLVCFLPFCQLVSITTSQTNLLQAGNQLQPGRIPAFVLLEGGHCQNACDYQHSCQFGHLPGDSSSVAHPLAQNNLSVVRWALSDILGPGLFELVRPLFLFNKLNLPRLKISWCLHLFGFIYIPLFYLSSLSATTISIKLHFLVTFLKDSLLMYTIQKGLKAIIFI
ncbi:hypothetical protein EDC94DRAFT_191094 [Helicostylum pulchrum]|nr:hypothetical protein EDC94DRAFT_191094 [Helicostylum pulchrum]